jgi:hypothetical protein
MQGYIHSEIIYPKYFFAVVPYVYIDLVIRFKFIPEMLREKYLFDSAMAGSHQAYPSAD